MLTFTTGSDGPGHFERNGRRHQIISGALHYFRVPHALWRDRLQRLAAMGCNTVETYVAWNFHQPHAGKAPDFTGDRDLGHFLDLAAETDLDVIVRPGPYICAEWDLGGLPSWLLADPQLRHSLRTQDPAFLGPVDTWLDELLPVITARQVTRGGRVVAVQVENEYGSFGDDHTYLAHLRDGLLARGVDTLLFTSDGPGGLYLASGTLDDLLPMVNFGSRQAQAFATLDAFRPGVPGMCMEFWNVWFDHWGTEHHIRAGADAAEELRQMLADGRSVNFYMAHGGTNFGIWAGANSFPTESHPDYSPTTTSYDYDAPIAEDGTLTEKFDAFRRVISAHTGLTPPPAPADAPATTAQQVRVTGRVALSAVLDTLPATHSPAPRSFEAQGVHHGVVRYRARTTSAAHGSELHLHGLADLAAVNVDGRAVGHVRRRGLTSPDPRYQDGPVALPHGDEQTRNNQSESNQTRNNQPGSNQPESNQPGSHQTSNEGAGGDHEPDGEAGMGRPAEHTVEITVHSLGRVNFGAYLHDSKGLTAVQVDFQHIFGWEHSALDLTSCPGVPWNQPDGAEPSAHEPAFHRALLTIDEPADGHLDMSGWDHGYVYLNGFNLGRYWTVAGPQRSLYAPAPLWRAGQNEVVILEFGTAGRHVVLNPAATPQPVSPS